MTLSHEGQINYLSEVLNVFQNICSLCFTVSVTEQMTAIRRRNETSVIGQIGDDLLAWVIASFCVAPEACRRTGCKNVVLG